MLFIHYPIIIVLILSAYFMHADKTRNKG